MQAELKEVTQEYIAALHRFYAFEDIMSLGDNELYAGIKCYNPTTDDMV